MATPDTVALPETLRVHCSICGVVVAKRGLGAHCARAHSMFRLARAFVDGDGVCPVCQGNFFIRLRCMHHVHHSSAACLAALQSGAFEQLPVEQITRLDALDVEYRRCELRNGRSFLNRPWL